MLTRRVRSAFTLVELLVVVAIIGLLISILLPSLSAGGEKAKVAKCTAQLRNLMIGTYAYFGEYNETFPFIVGQTGGPLGVCTWSYGGKFTDAYWQNVSSGVFYFRSDQKPLNPYIQGASVGPFEEVPVQRCPSDVSTFQRVINSGVGASAEPDPISTYDDIGTSYNFNFHALDTTSGGRPDPWVNSGAGWQSNLRALLRESLGGFSSRMVFFQEGPSNFAIRYSIQRVGNHREFSKHSVAMVDGHAEYRLLDTRKWCGSGWYMINPNWVWRIGSPRPAPISYPLTKRCD